MARIVLKVDVDTLRGTREGVAPLMETLRANDARATFLFSLGPDHTGRAIKRVFRPGFLTKVSRTSVVSHYGLKTLMYGTLLPGPDIGRKEAQRLRTVRDAGHEVGIHCWDHIDWQDNLLARSERWAEAEMDKAARRFREVFGVGATVHGAAGWQFNDAAARAEKALGIGYASDTRGRCPFQPVDSEGRAIGPVQMPTTLPTLDELIGLNGVTEDNVHETLLAATRDAGQDHVYTLHAELEGMRLRGVFARLLEGWRAQGHRFVTLGEMHAGLVVDELPWHRIVQGSVEGRSGVLALQGD